MPRPLRLRLIRVSQKKFTASAAAIITNERGEILLLDHYLRAGASWGFPGGFLEYAEQPAEAIRRELKEETGLELKNVRLLSPRVINGHIEFLFRAQADGEPRVLSREIRRAEWFAPDNLPENLSRKQRAQIREVLQAEFDKKLERD